MRPDLIVIGASTGGIEALKQLVSRLPVDFPAAVLIVLHIGAHESILPALLSAVSKLPVRHAQDNDAILEGAVLIAPPDHHLVVENDCVRVLRGAKENFSRPAIDPLFRSAAINHRERVIGVVLTGNLDDGTIGLQAIKAYGGTAVVQDPNEAIAPSMPRSAMTYVEIDFCLPVDRIAETLCELVIQDKADVPEGVLPRAAEVEYRLNLNEMLSMEEMENIGTPSGLTCPECHGALWQVDGAAPMRFRCHTGHGFTAASLNAEQDRTIEEAIWSAVRALHEKEALLLRTAKHAAESERQHAADEHVASAHLAAGHAKVLRKLLEPQLTQMDKAVMDTARGADANGGHKGNGRSA